MSQQQEPRRNTQESGGKRELLSYALRQNAGGDAHCHRHQTVETSEQPDLRITEAEVFLDRRQQRGEAQARHLNRHHRDDGGGERWDPTPVRMSHRLYTTRESTSTAASAVGRTPWSAADAHVGLLLK